MHGDFYTTTAQVLPVLLLALIWDSAYLERLRGQRRLRRSEDPDGVRFWTKPRVRAYTLFVAVVVLSSIGVTMLELSGLVPDSFGLRLALICALAITLATMITRIYFELMAATAPGPGDSAR
jgi:hypothetical protein